MATVIKIVVLGILILAIISFITPVFAPVIDFIDDAITSEIGDMANGFYDAMPSDIKYIIALGLTVLAIGIGLDLVFRK